MCIHVLAQSLSRVPLFVTPWAVAHQAPLSMGFPRQEYWSGLPFPSPGDLPDPGIEQASPVLAGRLFTTVIPGKTKILVYYARGRQCSFLLCLHPQGCLQRGFRASGSFQEHTGKLGSFSMWYHPRGYVSNFLGRPASS